MSPVSLPTMRVVSVNVGRLEPTEASRKGVTGHRKRPVEFIEVFSPDVEKGRSGVVGDAIGDGRHHGGTTQALYAYASEDLDWWAATLGAQLPPGSFGENLTTTGIDVNAALVGERWRIGDTVEVVVTDPRIPCRTFAGEMNQPQWVKRFTAERKPGPYFRVAVPGTIRAGDAITVIDRPAHSVTVADLFGALTSDPHLANHCLSAGAHLTGEAFDALTKRNSTM